MGTPRNRPNQVRLRLSMLVGDQEMELGLFPLSAAAAVALRQQARSSLRLVPRFALTRGAGGCCVTFEHDPAPFAERAGMDLIEWLLRHPDTPIHPLKLLALVAGQQPVEQRAAGLDDAAATQQHLQRKAAAEAILESDETSAAEKREAQAELDALEAAAPEVYHRTKDGARKAVRGALQAIHRAVDSLATAVDKRGQPIPVLRAFGEHLKKYLLDVSRLAAIPKGHLVYRPPADVEWS